MPVNEEMEEASSSGVPGFETSVSFEYSSSGFSLALNEHSLGASSLPLAPLSSTTTVSDFVSDYFVPDFIASKRSAGQLHFFSMLKHVISPEHVERIQGRQRLPERSRLFSSPDWPYLGEMRIAEVDSQSVSRLIDAALESGYSPQTITHIRNVVRSVFALAIRTGHYLGANPADTVQLPPMRRKDNHTLSMDQIGYLLHAMCYPEREIALFVMLADLSAVETCALLWRHINILNTSRQAHQELIPPHSIAVRLLRNRAGLERTVGARKRFVRADHSLCLVLRELQEKSRFSGQDDFVFASRNGTAIHPENVAARRLKKVGKASGMEWLSWSVFRRTGIRARAEMGSAFGREIERILRGLPPIAV